MFKTDDALTLKNNADNEESDLKYAFHSLRINKTTDIETPSKKCLLLLINILHLFTEKKETILFKKALK